ncbi:MAG: Gfo/Idh/MocA family oxidoreductase [Halioglobus sp.]
MSEDEHPARKVVVVGARSARQGTGPFIARAFDQLGADVCAVVGTSSLTNEQALDSLRSEQGIHCRAYTDLEEAIAAEQPDAVAICSPYPFHAEQLALVAASGCHCLVEKPLVWPCDEADLEKLVSEFSQRDLLLQMVTQWPGTLGAFTELHGAPAEPVTDFAMRLSPISIGPDMVPDSAPHFISLLQALVGPGECLQVTIQRPRDDALIVACDYVHDTGTTRAQLLLETCEQRPRPAWYQINQQRVDRVVELPQYIQQLVAEDRTVTLSDPLEGVVKHFMDSLAAGKATHSKQLLQGHRNLLQLAAAWPENR